MSSVDVVTFGEAMAMFVAKDVGDLSRVHEFTRRAAGAELNVAIGLARLGFRVGWVSRVGSDSFGRFILDVLDRERVDRQRVIVDPAPASQRGACSPEEVTQTGLRTST
jgi:2-dehydro-3-deoxygluconokinase